MLSKSLSSNNTNISEIVKTEGVDKVIEELNDLLESREEYEKLKEETGYREKFFELASYLYLIKMNEHIASGDKIEASLNTVIFRSFAKEKLEELLISAEIAKHLTM